MRTESTTGLASAVLAVSFELSDKKWLLGFLAPGCSRVRFRSVAAGDRLRVLTEIERAKKSLGLPAECRVESCYEAGREGFWIHRWLTSLGIRNHVVHSTSIEVPQQRRRRKTDRIDAEKLVEQLSRYVQGQAQRSWREVHVPSEEAEDERYEARDRERLVIQRTRLRNQILTRLRTHGITKADPLKADVTKLRDWNGKPLGRFFVEMLRRTQEALRLMTQQLHELEAAREERIESGDDLAARRIRALQDLRAIGPTTASSLIRELGWRGFRNRREIAAVAGLAGTPWESGERRHDQGVGDGIPRIRSLMVEISWQWLRYQPTSALAQWYRKRFAQGKRRIGIVALARKLLIALWRYWTHGDLPEGARLKPTHA